MVAYVDRSDHAVGERVLRSGVWLLMSDAAFDARVLAGRALVLPGALWLVVVIFGAIVTAATGGYSLRPVWSP